MCNNELERVESRATMTRSLRSNIIVRAGQPEIAVQECDAMKRLTPKKLNAVQCKHKWKGLVLTPEAHIHQEKAQTEVKTDRLDLVIRISTSTTYRMEREKSDRRALAGGGETLQYATEHHRIGYGIFGAGSSTRNSAGWSNGPTERIPGICRCAQEG